MHTVLVVALVLSAASVAELVAWAVFAVRAWKEWRRSPFVATRVIGGQLARSARQGPGGVPVKRSAASRVRLALR